jgi:hypothetical protein
VRDRIRGALKAGDDQHGELIGAPRLYARSFKCAGEGGSPALKPAERGVSEVGTVLGGLDRDGDDWAATTEVGVEQGLSVVVKQGVDHRQGTVLAGSFDPARDVFLRERGRLAQQPLPATSRLSRFRVRRRPMRVGLAGFLLVLGFGPVLGEIARR